MVSWLREGDNSYGVSRQGTHRVAADQNHAEGRNAIPLCALVEDAVRLSMELGNSQAHSALTHVERLAGWDRTQHCVTTGRGRPIRRRRLVALVVEALGYVIGKRRGVGLVSQLQPGMPQRLLGRRPLRLAVSTEPNRVSCAPKGPSRSIKSTAGHTSSPRPSAQTSETRHDGVAGLRCFVLEAQIKHRKTRKRRRGRCSPPNIKNLRAHRS